MKIEKFNFTVLCLTVITVASFIYDYGFAALLLWAAYGCFKMEP